MAGDALNGRNCRKAWRSFGWSPWEYSFCFGGIASLRLTAGIYEFREICEIFHRGFVMIFSLSFSIQAGVLHYINAGLLLFGRTNSRFFSIQCLYISIWRKVSLARRDL